MNKTKSFLFLLLSLGFLNTSAIALPFQPGEILSYHVKWKYGIITATAGKFVGTVQNPETLPEGTVVYPITGTADSMGLASTFHFFHFDLKSLVDQSRIFSHQFEKHGKEKNDHRDVFETYNPVTHEATYEHSINSDKAQLKTSILPGTGITQDPLSTLYFLRSAILPTQSGRGSLFAVTYEGETWGVKVKFLNQETLEWNNSSLNTDVYELEFYHDGVLTPTNSKIWITTDSKRLIIKCVSELSFGKIVVSLDKPERK